jgi:hypothetical protein
MGRRIPAARPHLCRLLSSHFVGEGEGGELWISTYIPIRVGASELEWIELEQSQAMQ